MREAGVNIVTLGVFARAQRQPTADTWSFRWLDVVMDLLHDNGIAVDLATATASPPPTSPPGSALTAWHRSSTAAWPSPVSTVNCPRLPRGHVELAIREDDHDEFWFLINLSDEPANIEGIDGTVLFPPSPTDPNALSPRGVTVVRRMG